MRAYKQMRLVPVKHTKVKRVKTILKKPNKINQRRKPKKIKQRTKPKKIKQGRIRRRRSRKITWKKI